MDRDDFLARVRHAAGRATLPEVPLDDPGLLVPDLADVDLVEQFMNSVSMVAGQVHSGDPLDLVLRIARDAGARSFMAWDGAELPVPGVAVTLQDAGLTEVDPLVRTEVRLEHQMGYLDLDLGVTGAIGGFAESGSLVVASGPGRPRMASLIPDVHIAFLRRTDIHRSLAHWAADHGEVLSAHTNVVFITGPSRTGDIEMNLNIGVHGPKEVHVILL